jgi:hypothetical protein
MNGTFDILPRLYYGSSVTVYSQAIDTSGSGFIAVQGIADVAPGTGTWAMQLQHSNVNEESQFTNVGSNVNINGTDTSKFVYNSQFGRYVRLKLVTSGGVTGFFRAVAVAKEHA